MVTEADTAGARPDLAGLEPLERLRPRWPRILGALLSGLMILGLSWELFDHGWADACERAGIAYYPKLLGAVPFSPVSAIPSTTLTFALFWLRSSTP